ncbi:MAG: rhodanese-like domain-containing protein [Gemmataceae bacterium]
MFKHITPRELADRQAAGDRVHLLDVRLPWEHATAALPDSQLIPLPQLPARVDEVQPPPGVPVVVYCHHGVRSQHAALILAHAGFPDVYSLAGGIDAWSIQVDARIPRY